MERIEKPKGEKRQESPGDTGALFKDEEAKIEILRRIPSR